MMSFTALDLAFFLLDLTELSEQVTEEFAGVASSFYILLNCVYIKVSLSLGFPSGE